VLFKRPDPVERSEWRMALHKKRGKATQVAFPLYAFLLIDYCS